MAETRASFPTEPESFAEDERISYSKTAQTHVLEDENGEEWEWLSKPEPGRWVPVMDESLMEMQRQTYKVEGVDEDEPALDPRKRKAVEQDKGAAAKKQKAEEPSKKRQNTAVYVTSLPDDVTEEELHDVFSKYGVIAERLEDSKPRIKLYVDEKGDFKGDALIVYFRPESVGIAIQMLDETDFRMGRPAMTGPMRVKEADASYKAQKDQPLASEEAKKKGTPANRDRQKVMKKTQQMNSRLADWDDDDPSTVADTSSRWDKIVVLKQMFTLSELADDPAAMLEIKEDIREECGKFGDVTNLVVYDKEEDGVVTVRFANAQAAAACVKAFDGRWYDRRRLEAYISRGNERFKKSKKQETNDDEDEARRVEEYTKFIEKE